MHLFESICYAYIQNLKKLDDSSEEGIFVVYDKYISAYMVYFPEKEVVRIVWPVKFINKFSEEYSNPTTIHETDDDTMITKDEMNM